MGPSQTQVPTGSDVVSATGIVHGEDWFLVNRQGCIAVDVRRLRREGLSRQPSELPVRGTVRNQHSKGYPSRRIKTPTVYMVDCREGGRHRLWVTVRPTTRCRGVTGECLVILTDTGGGPRGPGSRRRVLDVLLSPSTKSRDRTKEQTFSGFVSDKFYYQDVNVEKF